MRLAAAAFLMASVSMPALAATSTSDAELLYRFAAAPAVPFIPDGQSLVVDASGVAHTNSPPRLATSSSAISTSDLAGFVAFSGTNLTATIPSMPSGSTVEICNYDATALALSPSQPIKGYASGSLPGLSNGLASCLNLVSMSGQWWATVAIPGAVTTTQPPPTPPPASDTLVLQMSEDRWQTDAQFNVYMDGVRVNANPLTTTAIHGHGSQAFTFTGGWGSGAHTLGVEFLNDAYGGPGQDINLYLDGASYDGVAASGGLVLYSNGVQTLVLP
jgi:Ca-dependent carbohydrate-binding module xylan-binding